MTDTSSGWMPIKYYDAMTVKPKRCAFFIKAYQDGMIKLDAGISGDRSNGFRKVTHFQDLGDDPVQP
jgi:hypothetical protein